MRSAFVLNGPCGILCFWLLLERLIISIVKTHTLSTVDSPNLCPQSSTHMEKTFELAHICCCCSVAQSCLTLWDPIDCSMPGLPVPHHFPEFAQVHVHCISDAIQPSHPLTPSSPSALYLSQQQGLVQWVGCSYQINKILELQLQHQSFQLVFRVDLPWGWLIWSLYCPRDFQESSPVPWFKGINSLALCLLYSPALTTVYDYWKYKYT